MVLCIDMYVYIYIYIYTDTKLVRNIRKHPESFKKFININIAHLFQ